MTRVVPLAGILLLVAACTGPPPPVAYPEDLSRLDPAVREAIEEAGAAAEREPSGDSYGRLGRIYQANEFFELARRSYEAAAALDPETTDWSYYLGRLAAERGQEDEAIFRLGVVVEHDPDDSTARYHLARAQLAAGRDDEARHNFERLCDDPALAAWGELGLARLARRGDSVADAAVHVAAALEAEPRLKEAAYLAALVYRELGDETRARRELLRFETTGRPARPPDPRWQAVEQHATGSYAALREAHRLRSGGRLDEAEAIYRRLHRARPDDLSLVVNLAELLLQQRRFADAEALWAEAAAAHPRAAPVRLGRARALAGLRRYSDARAELELILDIDPENGEARTWLGRVTRAAGEAE